MTEDSLIGKKAAITGATGGLGKEICRKLLRLGCALVLVNRSESKTKALISELCAEFRGASITYIIADLESKESVARAADELAAAEIDILVHNAGIYAAPLKTTDFGYNNIFTVNFISPYYITKKLLPCLRLRGGRIVTVGSIAHRLSKTAESDPDFCGRSATVVYGNSKRYLMSALTSLLEENGVAHSLTHPGITYTNITSNYPLWVQRVIEKPMKLIFIKPCDAAEAVVKGVRGEVKSGYIAGPKILGIWGRPAVRRFRSVGQSEAKRIYSLAEKIYSQNNTIDISRQKVL